MAEDNVNGDNILADSDAAIDLPAHFGVGDAVPLQHNGEPAVADNLPSLNVVGSAIHKHLPKVSPPAPLRTEGSLTENWRLWKQMWNNYAILTNLHIQRKEYQTALFLHSIGPDALKIYNGLSLSETDKQNISLIIEKFDEFTIGELNDTYERYVFNNRTQREGESIEQYVATLRNLANTCKFCKCLHESLIRDRVVTGINNSEARKLLLQRRNLTLCDAIEICKSLEATESRLKVMTGMSEKVVNKIKSSKKKKSFSSNPDKSSKTAKKCLFCGGLHEMKKFKCPAYGKICKSCSTPNHFANVCKKKKKVHTILDTSSSYSDDSDLEVIHGVKSVNSVKNDGKSKAIFAEMIVGGKPVKFQVDSGAETNLIPLKYAQDAKIRRTTKVLLMWNGSKEYPIGTAYVKLNNPINEKRYKVEFTVVKDSLQPMPILGLKAAEKMKRGTVIKRLNDRSYEIETQAGVFRRNRTHLREANEPQTTKVEPIPTEPEITVSEKSRSPRKQVQNSEKQNMSIMSSPSVKNKKSVNSNIDKSKYTTRSGRVVTPPKRYDV